MHFELKIVLWLQLRGLSSQRRRHEEAAVVAIGQVSKAIELPCQALADMQIEVANLIS